jgi:hypothetical protein
MNVLFFNHPQLSDDLKYHVTSEGIVLFIFTLLLSHEIRRVTYLFLVLSLMRQIEKSLTNGVCFSNCHL